MSLGPYLLTGRQRLILLSAGAWLTIPLSTSNLVLSKLFPMSLGPILDFTICFIGAMGLYMYIFGYIKQFNVVKRYLFSLTQLNLVLLEKAEVVKVF